MIDVCSLCSHRVPSDISAFSLLPPWKKEYDKPRQHIKKQRHYFANKGLSSQSFGFSSSLVWIWELDYKENWAPKNRCFWTVMLEKTLESPLDCKEIKPLNPKGNQSWIFVGRMMLKLKLQCFGHLMQITESLERPWCWWRLNAGGEGEDWGWAGWMASPTRWTWVWASSGSWWWRRKPGVWQFMGLQRVGHDWMTELNWRRPLNVRPQGWGAKYMTPYPYSQGRIFSYVISNLLFCSPG